MNFICIEPDVYYDFDNTIIIIDCKINSFKNKLFYIIWKKKQIIL